MITEDRPLRNEGIEALYRRHMVPHPVVVGAVRSPETPVVAIAEV